MTQDTCSDVAQDIISTDAIELAYVETDVDTDIVLFRHTDKVTGESNMIGFSLRYWDSYQGTEQDSGAYIFRASNGAFDSEIYSRAIGIETKVCDAKQQFLINFQGDTAKYNRQIQGNAAVRISVDNNAPVMQFDVELFGIPNNSHLSREVIVAFHSDIKNEGRFFTDANGLAMQERVLNYRPTWDWTDAGVAENNITGNFYPIGSAVSIIDQITLTQMVVMNDRTQMGSVIQDGRIELVQNRAMNKDDSRGVSEVLDEKVHFANGTNIKDQDGHTIGISVPATYYVQLFNREHNESYQRKVQQIVDSPNMQFYAINDEEPIIASGLKGKMDDGFAQLLRSTGFTDEMKLELFLNDRNVILMRIENLMDSFDDFNGDVNYIKIALMELAEGLYTLVNGAGSECSVHIEEMNVTGSQTKDEVNARRIHWNTVDDNKSRQARDTEDTWDSIELQGQRIRVFTVYYNFPQEQQFLA